MSAPSRPGGLCLLALAAIAACLPDRPREPAPAALRPQATLHGVRMRVFQGEELVLEGRAARLSFHRATRDVTAEEALLQFRPTRRAVELRAPEVKGNLGSRAADLSGGVYLRGALTGETDRVHFDWPSLVASGDLPVTLRGPSYAVRAGSFRLDLGQEAFELTGDVATELREAGR